MIRKLTLTLTLAVALLAAGCATPAADTEGTLGAASTQKIVLAIQPTDNAGAIQDKATELETFLEAEMAKGGLIVDVEIIVPLTYVGTVEALRFGHAQVAMMSAWPAVMANQKAGAEVVLAEMREVFDANKTPVVAPYYYSYYVVLPDSPFQTLEDARGAKVAYSSPSSTSGYIYPLATLVNEGLVTVEEGKAADAEQFFGEARFAGGYTQAWEALQNGQVDVAVTAGDINANLYNEVIAGTRVIAEQGPIPSHAVLFAEDFAGTPEAEAFEAAFLQLKGEKKDLMRNLVSGIFVEFKPTTTKEHLSPLADALAVTNLKYGESFK